MKKLLPLVFLTLPGFAAELGGTWRLQGTVADVTIDRVCTIKQTGAKIAGDCKTENPNAIPEVAMAGEVDGRKVSWQYESKYQGATVVLKFAGSLAGDEIKGTVTASDLAGASMTSGPFTAKKR